MDPVPASLLDCVVVPPGSPALLRAKLAPGSERRLRMAYITGPGDVVGTFRYWRDGLHDPRVPVITYSNMFYSLVQKADADALIVHQHPSGDAPPQSDRFRFQCVPRGDREGRMRYLLEGRRFAREVLRELEAYGPDVVVIGADSPPGLLRALPRGWKVILSVHNSFWPMGRKPTSARQRLQLAWLGRSLRGVSAAVCTSSECLSQLATLRTSEGCLFVETPQWPAPSQEPAARTGPVNRLLYAGRVEENKGVFDLLDAFNILADNHPQLTLAIAGSGSADAELALRVAASPARARIFQLGQLPAAQLRKEFQSADLLVCPTRSDFNEGLALVVVEAAASGTPSIASSVVPAKDLVGDACLVFRADDTDALRKALETAIGDAALFQSMRQATQLVLHQMTDRQRSWGSRLLQAMVC